MKLPSSVVVRDYRMSDEGLTVVGHLLECISGVDYRNAPWWFRPSDWVTFCDQA